MMYMCKAKLSDHQKCSQNSNGQLQFYYFKNQFYRRFGNFHFKNIFVVCENHENKNTKYILQQKLITMVSTFCTHGFTTQLAIVVLGKKAHRFSTAVASYFARDGLRVRYSQMTHGKRMTTFSVSDNRPSLLPQHVYTAFLGTVSHASSWPTARGRYKCSKLFCVS